MGYSRAIKLDINNINSLYYALSKGKLKQFVDCVKESQSVDKKLMLCFRTNKGKETVTIYYNNHQVWKLYISNQNPVVEISGNHARDSKNWFDLLKGIGVDEETLNNPPRKDGKINFERIKFTGTEIDDDFAVRTLPYILQMIDDYMDTTKIFDWFKNDNHKRSNGEVGKKDLEEKKQQQLYYLSNCKFSDGLFVYDMEFAQEYKDGDEKAIDGDAAKNQADCMGIRFDSYGNPVALVYIEIKSKETSVKQNSSGLREHLKKMDAYLLLENSHIAERVNEAKEIISCYKALGLRNIPESYQTDSLDILNSLDKQEVLMVFTGDEDGGASNYYLRKNNKAVTSWLQPYSGKSYKLTVQCL